MIIYLGKPPFETSTYEDTYRRIRNVDLVFPLYLSSEVKDLLSKLLVHDPGQRLSLQEVLKHPWIVKYQIKLDQKGIDEEGL